MTSMVDKIMKRVSAHGRGKWVCTPKDFLDLGSREAVDQALYRLIKGDRLRRVGRGLYDMPRFSEMLKCLAPADMDAAIAAIARRDGISIMPGGLVYANRAWSHQCGSRQGDLHNGRPLKDAQDRRANGSVSPCESKRHAVGKETKETRSFSGASTAVAWTLRCCGRTCRSDLETPSARPREA